MQPDHIKKGYCPRLPGVRMPATYINHYAANGGVVVPQFGGAHLLLMSCSRAMHPLPLPTLHSVLIIWRPVNNCCEVSVPALSWQCKSLCSTASIVTAAPYAGHVCGDHRVLTTSCHVCRRCR